MDTRYISVSGIILIGVLLGIAGIVGVYGSSEQVESSTRPHAVAIWVTYQIIIVAAIVISLILVLIDAAPEC